jgi:hypothetical protein
MVEGRRGVWEASMSRSRVLVALVGALLAACNDNGSSSDLIPIAAKAVSCGQPGALCFEFMPPHYADGPYEMAITEEVLEDAVDDGSPSFLMGFVTISDVSGPLSFRVQGAPFDTATDTGGPYDDGDAVSVQAFADALDFQRASFVVTFAVNRGTTPPFIVDSFLVTIPKCGEPDPGPEPGPGILIEDLPEILFAMKIVHPVTQRDNFQVVGVNADGSGFLRVSDNDSRDRHPRWPREAGLQSAPVCTARLSCCSDNGVIDGPAKLNVVWCTWTLNVDNPLGLADERSTLAANEQLSTPGQSVTRHDWSPDGTRIAYEANGDLFVVASEPGGVPTPLTQGPEDDGYPTWSQDGTRIAFIRRDLGTGAIGLWIMDADGTDAALVLAGVVVAAWSPDPDAGRRIAIVTPTMGLQVLEDDGTVAPFGDDTAPAGEDLCWSPDGTAIFTHGAGTEYAIVTESETVVRTVEGTSRIEGGTWR